MTKSSKKASSVEVIEVVEPSGRSRRLSKKREELRDRLWPEASDRVWSRKKAKGFTSIPRTLPLIMRLLGDLTTKGNPSTVYLDLWFRAFDEGLVTIRDEEEMAYACGYDGPRAARTWRDHINTLAMFGFIKTKELGNRDVGHVLLLDPHFVVTELHGRTDKPVAEKWWNAFVTRANEIGAQLPELATDDMPPF